MIIEKDIVLKTYIVWEVHKNCKVELFRGTKKECKNFIKSIDK